MVGQEAMRLKRGLAAALVIMILVAVGCGTNGTPSPPAPRLGAIEGTVTDESGEPVPSVRVFIVGGTVPFRSGTRFIVRAIPEGHMFGEISFMWEISVTGRLCPPCL